jgi:hypothetical protein
MMEPGNPLADWRLPRPVDAPDGFNIFSAE